MEQLIEKLYIKTDSMCVGDNLHNEYVDFLIKDIPDNEANKVIIEYFSKGNWHTGHWIYDIYTKEELRSLNVIMRTKNKDTLTKRIIRMTSKLSEGNPYMLMLERNKIIGLTNLLESFAIKYMEGYNG